MHCSDLIYTMYVAVVHELEPTPEQSPEEGHLSLEVRDWLQWFFFSWMLKITPHLSAHCKGLDQCKVLLHMRRIVVFSLFLF